MTEQYQDKYMFSSSLLDTYRQFCSVGLSIHVRLFI